MMLQVVFFVLMIFWLVGYGYNSSLAAPNPRVTFATGALIPWACVAILGWVVFNSVVVVNR